MVSPLQCTRSRWKSGAPRSVNRPCREASTRAAAGEFSVFVEQPWLVAWWASASGRVHLTC